MELAESGKGRTMGDIKLLPEYRLPDRQMPTLDFFHASVDAAHSGIVRL